MDFLKGSSSILIKSLFIFWSLLENAHMYRYTSCSHPMRKPSSFTKSAVAYCLK